MIPPICKNPAIGLIITNGRKERTVAIERNTALLVSIVIQNIITKLIICDPSKENN